MHKIFELKAMELEQLQSLAAELGIKGFKRLEKDDLVYAIIDAEAIRSAQAPVEKPAKKRGRPRKEESQKETVKEKQTVQTDQAKTDTPADEQKADNQKSKSDKPKRERKRQEKPKAEVVTETKEENRFRS